MSTYVIPSNDDAIRAIKLLVGKIADAAVEGRAMRKDEVEEEAMKSRPAAIEEAELSDEELLGEATLAKLTTRGAGLPAEEDFGYDIAEEEVEFEGEAEIEEEAEVEAVFEGEAVTDAMFDDEEDEAVTGVVFEDEAEGLEGEVENEAEVDMGEENQDEVEG